MFDKKIIHNHNHYYYYNNAKSGGNINQMVKNANEGIEELGKKERYTSERNGTGSVIKLIGNTTREVITDIAKIASLIQAGLAD